MFPSALETIVFESEINPKLKFTFASGEKALRFVLRSFQLPKGSRVAIPAFVCDSVDRSVRLESLEPFYLDLTSELSFWGKHDLDLILLKDIKAILLVHLYGEIHPQTNEIIQFCKNNHIYLLHDVAQSLGVDEKRLKEGSIVYSFGPGKSGTAAMGGWIPEVSEVLYRSEVEDLTQTALKNWILNQRAKNFLKTRIYQNHLTLFDEISNRGMSLITGMITWKGFFSMSSYQKKAASYLMSCMKNVNQEREKRWNIYRNAFRDLPTIRLLNTDPMGIKFKCILHAGSDLEKLLAIFHRHQISYFQLFPTVPGKLLNLEIPIFYAQATKIIELSTESSIPLPEIERVASLIRSKMENSS